MRRWTVRGLPPEAICVIQDLATSTGTSLGEALAAAIRHGAPAARQEFKDRCYAPDLIETLERIQDLQLFQAETLRGLYASARQYDVQQESKEIRPFEAC